jgi:hypothetical protein
MSGIIFFEMSFASTLHIVTAKREMVTFARPAQPLLQSFNMRNQSWLYG